MVDGETEIRALMKRAVAASSVAAVVRETRLSAEAVARLAGGLNCRIGTVHHAIAERDAILALLGPDLTRIAG